MKNKTKAVTNGKELFENKEKCRKQEQTKREMSENIFFLFKKRNNVKRFVIVKTTIYRANQDSFI